MSYRRKGFTLIELIIVIIIIGILASITAPMMKGLQDKAIKTEAMVGLRSILDAWKQYMMETGTKDIMMYFPEGTWTPNDTSNPIGKILPPDQLNGAYFSRSCYGLIGEYGDVWFLYCAPSESNNPRVQNFKPIQMDLRGRVWQGPIVYGKGYDDVPPEDRLN